MGPPPVVPLSPREDAAERTVTVGALAPAEASALRAQGFDFYDWPAPADKPGLARLVTSWHHGTADVGPLADAIRNLVGVG